MEKTIGFFWTLFLVTLGSLLASFIAWYVLKRVASVGTAILPVVSGVIAGVVAINADERIWGAIIGVGVFGGAALILQCRHLADVYELEEEVRLLKAKVDTGAKPSS